MPLYNVVRVEGREAIPIVDCNGQAIIWACPEQATRYAQDETRYRGVKHQIRQVKEDVNWQEREQKRFDSGHYTKLPWHNEAWVKQVERCAIHFAHVSRQNQANVAFISTELNGIRDVKTTNRASTYLARYYSTVLNEAQIRQWVATYKKLYDKDSLLKFACDDKEIVRVYKNGPQSCMKNPPHRSKVHPAAVYAGPDLAVAYLEKNGTIIARAVVWPKKQIHSRIYGDVHLMEELLRDEGYRNGSLAGAKLTKIKQGNRYVCPYIDSVRQVKATTKYLIIDPKGKRYAGNQDGFCGRGFKCASCREDADLDKVGSAIVHGNHWCHPCRDKALTDNRIFECAFSGQCFMIGEAVTMYNGEVWYRGYIDYHRAFRCGECKLYYPLLDRRGHRAVPNHLHAVVYNHKTGTNDYKCVSCGVRQKELPL